jgi:hypothetical protein
VAKEPKADYPASPAPEPEQLLVSVRCSLLCRISPFQTSSLLFSFKNFPNCFRLSLAKSKRNSAVNLRVLENDTGICSRARRTTRVVDAAGCESTRRVKIKPSHSASGILAHVSAPGGIGCHQGSLVQWRSERFVSCPCLPLAVRDRPKLWLLAIQFGRAGSMHTRR